MNPQILSMEAHGAEEEKASGASPRSLDKGCAHGGRDGLGMR